MNFFIADVQEGFGAFVAFYLADLKWSQEMIGLMLTIGKAVSAVSLIPGGALADAVHRKRVLVAAGVIMIAAAALILALHSTFPFVLGAELLHGATAGIMTPAIAAISLGIVGRRAISSRVGRNHRFEAAGSALTAAMMGALGSYVGHSTIFVMAAGLTLPGARRYAVPAKSGSSAWYSFVLDQADVRRRASITRPIVGGVLFLILLQCFDRPA